MRPEEHVINFHAETAKILRKERKATLSLRFLILQILCGLCVGKKETGLSSILIFRL